MPRVVVPEVDMRYASRFECDTPGCKFFRVLSRSSKEIWHPLYGRRKVRDIEELDIKGHDCSRYMASWRFVHDHVRSIRS